MVFPLFFAREKNGFSFECHMCSHIFSTRQTAQKDDVEQEVVEENNALWRLFRNAGDFSGGVCRDVVEKHVLPRLNSNDVKFLYGVNTETRKLIKRSSRKGELKKRFKVSEMSSESTLEFVWDESLWPSDWDETTFSREVCSNE